MLDKKISVSDQVNCLSTEAQLLFTWGIPHADDFGLLPHNANTLKAIIFPMKDIDTKKFNNWIKELLNQGLWGVINYEEKQYFKIIKFSEHQTLKKDRQPTSYINIKVDEEPKKTWHKIGLELEKYSESNVFQNGSNVFQNGSNLDPESIQSGSTPVPEVKRSEGKRSEGNFNSGGPELIKSKKSNSDSEDQSKDLGDSKSPAPEILEKKIKDPINQVIDVFRETTSPGINYANNTFRGDAKKLISMMGSVDKVVETAKAAISLQGTSQYVPKVTNPSQLLAKLPDLSHYVKNKKIEEKGKGKGCIGIAW